MQQWVDCKSGIQAAAAVLQSLSLCLMLWQALRQLQERVGQPVLLLLLHRSPLTVMVAWRE
jgi:hypothetical protein